MLQSKQKTITLVCNSANNGMGQVAIQTGKPIVFGVLSTDTIDQAQKRCDDKKDNKRRSAAVTAIEMISVLSQIKGK